MTQTSATLERASLARWRNAIVAAFGLGGISVSAWGPRLPAVTEELGVNTGTIGLLLACVTVGSIGGLLAATPILHWLGSRRSVTGALLIVAAGIALMGGMLAAGLLPLVAVAFAVTGFGIGTLDVLINVEGAAVERTAGRTLMPLMHAAWSVGAAIGSGIGAVCAAAGITPSMQFVCEAVAIAAVALAGSGSIPSGTREEDHGPAMSRADHIRQWLRGWTDWRLLLIGVVMLGVELGEGSANNWLTLSAQNDHGETAAVAALFFTVFATGEALARIFGGPVVDRLGRVRTIRVTTALGIAGLALFILGGSAWLTLPGVVLWAIGVSMGFPLGMSAAAESGSNPAARVSVVASIGYLANLAGPPAIGLLAESTGLLGAFWLIVALMAAALVSAGSLGARR
ncbi:MFS transporter [Sinomonas sp. ASV322]|uniref:MFS transporter n=1 Tax=Sinomonas sp. ASV322 TaxID=3041920 RepID=UPI0027DC9ED0|nr:MFS transporter [Sinomonas sp. ASV322]MDQ4501002.1 MFS transporter [Sinomonas sp. ASV322]